MKINPSPSLKKNGSEIIEGLLLIILATLSGKAWAIHRQNIASLVELQNSVVLSNEELLNAQTEKKQLAEALQNEQQKNEALEKQNNRINRKVDDLEKLAETDPELLKKYSKVYFLNENYVPRRLKDIPEEYVNSSEKSLQILSQVLPRLEDLIEDAKDDNVDIKIQSAYRSFQTQATLKSGYKVIYGAGTANQFSAEQGYSEHQLGTTVDLTTPAMGGNLTTTFDATSAFSWLQANAYKYGFVLSYPKGNLYYQYEPWHWRFVGEDLARKLHKDGKNFYDLDQRVIDNYLGEIFD